jgi:formylglycine-generating enzyme required for sulfatase activity
LTTKGFWLGKYAVTQEQWETVMGSNPSYFSKQGDGRDKVQEMDTSRFPVEQVSWDDCQNLLKTTSTVFVLRLCREDRILFSILHFLRFAHPSTS